MSLNSRSRAAPNWFRTVLSFAACGFKRHPVALTANDLSDDVLCDIGLSRCLLLAGLADGRLIGPVD